MPDDTLRHPRRPVSRQAPNAQGYDVLVHGYDGIPGTTSPQAWQTLAPLNSLVMKPGDTISRYGGEVFTGSGLQFDAQDAGSATKPVIIHSYGGGRAEIRPSDGGHGISIRSTAGLVISDLWISGPGPGPSDRTSCSGIQAFH